MAWSKVGHACEVLIGLQSSSTKIAYAYRVHILKLHMMLSDVSCRKSEVHSSRTAVRLQPGNPAYLEDALQEGIVGSKAVMGGSAPAEQEGHGVTLIPKGGLDTNEHVAKLLAIDQQVLAL
jgi:hypothetical protein